MGRARTRVNWGAADFGGVARLAKLAANRQAFRRADIYEAVVSIYRTQASLLSQRERVLMREILRRLTPEVDITIRIAVAEKIADDRSAPLDLILLLIKENIEVARPVVLRCPLLSDEELLTVIADGDADRQTLCAERSFIGEPLVNALTHSNAEPVLIALLRNVTAKIGTAAFSVLVEKSKSMPRLREPLARRPDLPREFAAEVCGWTSDPAGRQQVSAHAVEHVSQRSAIEPLSDIWDGSRKLIEKLGAAGQLKPGFLLRVLQQGQLDLFELAFARLLQLDDSRMRRILYESGPRPVAMACRALGIDRCVFPTVYNLSRQARRVLPLLRPDDRLDADTVFTSYSKTEALARVQIC